MNVTSSIWNGVFDTWADASHAAGLKSPEIPQAFDTARWMDRQGSMLHSARSGVSPRFTNLPLLIGTTDARSVVDLGGGSGWTFELISKSNSQILERYIVLEQRTSVDAFSNNFISDQRVRFVPSEAFVNYSSQPADVLYSNSALQYLPDNDLLTRIVANCTPNWILLDDIQTGLQGEFFSMQHYYGIEIPCRFCDVNLMVDQVQSLGYSLKGNWEYPASIGGVLKPTLSSEVHTLHAIGTPRSLLFEAVQ